MQRALLTTLITAATASADNGARYPTPAPHPGGRPRTKTHSDLIDWA